MRLDTIRKYHILSEQFGLKKGTRYLGQEYKGKELQEIFSQNKFMMDSASPFLKQLYDYVKGTGFFLELVDRNGIILTIIGDDDIVRSSERVGMTVGTNMSIKTAGTNAISLVLEEDVSCQLRGIDHYFDIFNNYTCSGAPIHNEDGELIGCINLTGWKTEVHKHTMGLVVAAVNSIENQMKNTKNEKKLKQAYKYTKTIMNSIDEGIVTINDDGNILFINENACKILNSEENSILNKNFSEFISDENEIIRKILTERNLENYETIIKSSRKKILVESHQIYEEDNNVNGSVLLLKDIKKVMKLVDRYAQMNAKYTFDQIIGGSPMVKSIKEYAMNVADGPSTVLIEGESGTGKELFAQAIHNYSRRRKYPFVAINCGAIPKDLIESELFGYVEGAFTGARKGGYLGKFAIADKGTLFLDEISEMPIHIQVHLLRAIQEGQITRIGDTKPIDIDLRIIAATNKNLREEVDKGTFRKDLYYRLNVIPIELPPLRERKGDIELLINHFIEKKANLLGKEKPQIKKETIEKLKSYEWPGNIRELENTIERIVNLNEELILVDSTFETKDEDETPKKKNKIPICSLKELEKMAIEQTMELCDYNYSATAKKLGLNRTTLYNKIKKYNIVENSSRCIKDK